MRSSFSRNFVTYLVILLAALLIIGISFQMLVRGYLTDKAVDGLKISCSTLAQVASAYASGEGLGDREFLINLSVAANASQADAVICDSRGRILLCSNAPLGCRHQGLVISNRDYLQQVQTREYMVTTGVITGLYEEVRYTVSAPFRDQRTGQFLGFVMVSTPAASTTALIQRISKTYMVVSALVVLVAVAALSFYARRASEPLRHMAQAATAFGHGELSARVSVPKDSPEEIVELSLAFNNMAQSLQRSEYQRQEFVANVSHELKTPMTTISGYVDGILDGTISAQQQSHYLRIVSDETKRLSRLVRSMLDISRLQEQQGIPEEKKSRFDLCECAGQVLITFEKKILDKGLEVEVAFPELPSFTYADQDAITQVIYNLLDNGVKFSPQGGCLGLRLQSDGNKLYMSISNTGPTIPPSELPLLFDRFHKLDKARTQNRDGWGLGLYIVKTIIGSHGENISVTSENGKTEFTFTLPLVN